MPICHFVGRAIFSLPLDMEVNTLKMSGGKIIGEGEDGCVFTEPMWPCAKDQVSNLKDSRYVSKIVEKDDIESEYIRAATRILGPQLSARYIVTLKGECSPASGLKSDLALDENRVQLLNWDSEQACGNIKSQIQKGQSLTDSHKVMYMTRYPMTLSQWGLSSKLNIRQIESAISPFISILQKLYQNSSEQLINLDLHAGNIFVRPLDTGIQFGMADFGHCLLRQHIVGSGVLFFGKYLCEYTAAYNLYSGYIQIPFEARLLNFCYKKKFEHLTPGEFIKAWLRDPDVLKHLNELSDASMLHHTQTVNDLMTKPIFIAMIETIQSISRKLHLNPNSPSHVTQSLSANEKTVLEFIITRYAIISPINLITTICMMNNKKSLALIEFLTTAIRAPYDQVGSSIASAVTSVQRADLTIAWDDVDTRV